ncbi:hypothetical protein [Calycomorphotria hydatis]|uniref:hypothetical protein n=1 Tax=Calycomorphotria hydatis TaxID=2528027 RepID=UPI001E2D7BA1|nr:hypothetical protein [Calycomorphotria hydatis]
MRATINGTAVLHVVVPQSMVTPICLNTPWSGATRRCLPPPGAPPLSLSSG